MKRVLTHSETQLVHCYITIFSVSKGGPRGVVMPTIGPQMDEVISPHNMHPTGALDFSPVLGEH